jgi:4-carboxymuconolactone decarboxylase
MTGHDPTPHAVTLSTNGEPTRAEPIPPERLTAEQRSYYQQSKRQIEQQFSPDSIPSAIADNGALLGPWSVWLRSPDLGAAFAALQGTINTLQALPPRAQQVVILLTAASQRAAYELAGHRTLAIDLGFTTEEADALTQGYAPVTLARAERLTATAAQCMLAGGVLPHSLYLELSRTFGSKGPLHLCSIVGQYLFLAVTLNTFNVLATQ